MIENKIIELRLLKYNLSNEGEVEYALYLNGQIAGRGTSVEEAFKDLAENYKDLKKLEVIDF